MKNKKDYYIGLDIGTESVGYALTDDEYNLQKYKGNLMWGVNLFEEANQADERRQHRTARRRFNRRRQRINILQEIMAEEILKIDGSFFMRLKESALFPEDSQSRTKNIFFDDENYTDADYFKEYPTIHHLICELMKNKEAHDIRLVYLACAYILSHRGHFLAAVDKDNISGVLDFEHILKEFYYWFEFNDTDKPFCCDAEEFAQILKENVGITQKERNFKKLLFNGKIPTDPCEDYPIKTASLIKFISGGKVKLSDLFKKEEYADLEINSVSVGTADFDQTLEELASKLDDGDADLLVAVKKMNDWAVLNDILKGKSVISEAKVASYEQHKSDLKQLKYICGKYLTTEQYKKIFKDASEDANYVRYSYNVSSLGKNEISTKFNGKANAEDFCKYIKSQIKDIEPSDEDRTIFEDLMAKTENKTLCPKQVTTDNRVVPYQLYYAELKTILDNASKYTAVLNKSDEYGSVRDKILSLMTFRIPYYIGPLVSEEKSSFAWMKRKAEGEIYPWNFDEMVDKDLSEEAFIRRMTAKCTYLAGEDVLPKNSLLYCKFCVLNEINNIKINGNKISVAAKQGIYTELFEKRARVTAKMIKQYLLSSGEMTEADQLSGIDISVKSSLKSFHNFKKLLKDGILKENDVERIIERITVTTDKKRLKKWLKTEFSKLEDDDVTYIARLSYKDYGRLSRRFLCEINRVDFSTGEIGTDNIISEMWNTNNNLMQILAENYGYSKLIRAFNEEYYNLNPMSIKDRLDAMYVPNAVRRSVIRTLDIVKELKEIMKCAPKKIFVEMARDYDSNKKGQSTQSRKMQLETLLDVARSFTAEDEINHLCDRLENMSDSDLRSEKYYLYFTQLGKCMYSGESIDFDLIGSRKYDVDHIYPQSKVKDDSLDNKVLVLSEINGDKKDIYPIKSEIRHKMNSFWKSLKSNKLISDKKYDRLVRNTAFTNDELMGFINRQLVETRQSTKAVTQLIGEIFPDSDIVYVKAGIVSEFRKEYDMLKCREINDLHHAKDAYLNIVMGNVHDVKFTKNPMNIIAGGERYSLKLKTILQGNVERGGVCAWDAEKSFETVRKMMSKNSIRYVKYAYRRKGEFYHQNPDKAGEGLAPRKANLDPKKYGGYNNTTASYFEFVKCSNGLYLIPIELLYADKFETDESFAYEYSANILSKIASMQLTGNDISFPFGKRIIKVNTLIDIDGFMANIAYKSSGGKTVGIVSANSLITDKKWHDYIKRISSFSEKSERGTKFKVSPVDDITKEDNLQLFDLLCEKTRCHPFDKFFTSIGKKITAGRGKFEKLEVTEQVIALLNIVKVFKTGRSSGCDLSLIGESKQAAIIGVNANFTKIKNAKSIRIIDRSATGLLEKKSPNLLEL